MAEKIRVAELVVSFTQDAPLREIEHLTEELQKALKECEYVREVSVNFKKE